MAFLTGIKIRELIESKIIEVDSLDPMIPFDPRMQVTEDSLDLRLFPKALRIVRGIKEIDYLNDDLSTLYEEVIIDSAKGYPLKPKDILFCQSLEIISLPDHYVGLVLTRQTFAQLGLSITCGASKFAAGIRWAFPMQVINCGPCTVNIYPYTVIGQLLISTMCGPPIGYPIDGRFQNQFKPMPPRIFDRERTALRSFSADGLARITHIDKRLRELAEEAKQRQLHPKAHRKPHAQNRFTLKSAKAAIIILVGATSGWAVNLLSERNRNDEIPFNQWALIFSLFFISITFAILAAFWETNAED